MDRLLYPHTAIRPKLQVNARTILGVRLGDEVIITAKGRPAAVLVSYEEWESITETLAIKHDPALMKQIRASLQYVHRGGKGIPAEKVDWGRA